jgi:exodeoxyribonuclease-5
MDWSAQQQKALRRVSRWLRDGETPIFRLFGYAGTGKSTLARHLAEDAGRVFFAAYTGKAAAVLRAMGCPEAKTIHSLIYKVRDGDPSDLVTVALELEELRKADPVDEVAVKLKERELEKARQKARQPRFELNPDSKLRDADLLVVDEVSMVDERMGRDLLSFEVPILVLGDPAQLPPVRGAAFLTAADPDVMLTEIHRQARDDPIVRLASLARGRQLPPFGEYGETRVIRREEFDPVRELRNGEQIIVGKNVTRKRANVKRRARLGFEDPLPVAGDRLVCLRNNHDLGLANGAIWNVVERAGDQDEGYVPLLLEEDVAGGTRLAMDVHTCHFLDEDLPWFQKQEAEEFDYAYALTCHKAQGSQWDGVVVVDESACFRDNRWRWLYTAVTRAAEKLVLVRS